jgi:hypothetical protein
MRGTHEQDLPITENGMKTSEAELRTLMGSTGLNFTIDEDGDVRCVIGGLGPREDRTQAVWVNAHVDAWGKQYQDRDVFAVVAKLEDLPRSFDVMVKLLEIAGRKKGGSLVVVGGRIMYRFDVPLSSSVEHLRDTVFLCANIADELELVITNADDF